MKFEYLITDLDGTLVKLDINWEMLRNAIRKLLNTDHPLRPLATSIPIAAKGDSELIKKAFDYIKNVELKASDNIVRDEVLIDIFKWLKLNGVKIGLVTLQASEPATLVLRKLGILEYFSVIVTRDHDLYRINQLSLALKELKADAKKTVFIGDTQWDIEAGKALGCYTVSVNQSISGADYYVKNISELKQVFKPYP
ncbi:MAG: HAD family hydrolase [Thermoprotei archaeon]|jgi:HAD superfamily hydrolase (TIGR01549 family)